MEKYNNTVQDVLGNIVTSATITIFDAGTTDVSAIFEDDESTPLSNPFTVSDSNYSSDGSFWFVAANGKYDVKVVNGAEESTLEDAVLFDVDDAVVVSHSHIVTVSSEEGIGDYASIQAAVDFVDAQTDCFIAVVGSHLDYLDIGGGNFAGLSVAEWAVGSNSPALNVGNFSNDFDYLSNNWWFAVNSENQLYQILSGDSLGNFYTDSRKIGNAIVAASDESFTMYRENPYIIKLLDNEYTEKVTINSNSCIVFQGDNNTQWHRAVTSAEELITRGLSFKYGVIDFSGIVLGNENIGAIMDGSGNWGDNVVANENTIALRIHNNSTITVNGADFFSPAISIGTVKIEFITINHAPHTGLSHLFLFTAQGAISATNIRWRIVPYNLGVIESEPMMFDATQARKIEVNNIVVEIEDANDKISSLAILRGAKFCELVNVSNVSVSIDTPMANLGDNEVVLVALDGIAGHAQTPVLSSNINISDVTLNAPNAPAANMWIYKGLIGQTANVSVANIHGGKVGKSVDDTVVFQAQTTAITTI